MKMKKIINLITAMALLCSMFAVNVEAASYPLMFPEEYSMNVAKGTVAELKFTIFNEYKNEKYNVNVYKGTTANSNNLVASASNTIYNYGNYITNVTITWDTSDVECGVYLVEYWMSFYSIYEWHDAPTKSTLMRIYVNDIGADVDDVLHTDIKAYIDGHPIKSYNIQGKTAIVVEDLRNYGFNVTWDPSAKSLTVTDEKKYVTSNYTHQQNTMPVGAKAMDVLFTDIRTYVGKQKVTSYNVNGLTIIYIDDLDEFGNVVWDANARTISFTRK